MPHLFFFASCASIMVVELVAGRLVASHLGSSLYTWTAVIGVMLAGITCGNLIGGRLADQRDPAALVSWLFLLAAALCLLALGLNAVFAATRPLRGLPWRLQILLSVFAIFMLPATALGTLSPGLAKLAVTRGRHLGATLGSFYAVGTIGSIAGTLLTGFWLLLALGNTRVMVAAAVALALGGIGCALYARHGAHAPGTAPGTARGTAPGTAPGIAPGTARGTARGTAPGTARGTAPGTWHPAPGTFRPHTPHALAFFASLCLMVVEMLASRIIAYQAGSSLYTWTSVIGVVFAGMSTGNYVGGVLSDRIPIRRVLGWLLLGASLATTGVLIVAFFLENREPFAAWHWPALVFASVFSLVFLPSLFLGTIGPVATRMAVERTSAVGKTIGSVSAWNAAGSIVGTLAAGFWLIPALGTRSLVMLVAVLLAWAAAALSRPRVVQGSWAVAAAFGLLLTLTPVRGTEGWRYLGAFRETEKYAFSADSAYQYVRVYEEASDNDPGRKLRVLSLDHLIHGYVDISDPTFLNYGYERIYREILRRYMEGRGPASAFYIGGGSYTFPRWLLAERPGSRALVAEIDPLVLEANHRALGLGRETPIRTLLMDARQAVDTLPADARFDFFLGDAFNDLAVPYHLTTLEFDRMVARHLAPTGAYLVNVIDNYDSGLLLGAFVNTLERVFPHVYVLCTERGGVAHRRDTFVVAASNASLDTSGLELGHGTFFEGSLLTPANMAALRARSRGRILTDDDAPVENLIAPVVRERTGKDQ
ncbi:MAG: fused MFS/spermidine synthase [Bacteroidales bacterium]